MATMTRPPAAAATTTMTTTRVGTTAGCRCAPTINTPLLGQQTGAASAGGVADDIDRTGSSVSISVWVKVNAFTTNW